MASNTTLNAGAGGDVITTKERTHDGDATKQQVVSVAFATGSEGAYTHTDAVAGAGAVTAGVQRVTLASDDPAVVALQLIDNAISGSGFNITQLNGVNVTMGNGASGTGVQRVTLANDSTGVIATVSTVTNVATIGTSVTPGTSAAHLGKAEDAAHSSGDTGVMVLAVRNDAGTALAGTTGDYIPLSTDSSGALRVVGSSGTTQYTEDGASAGGESLCLMGAVRRDSAASSSGTDGDYSTINTDANGNLRVAVSAGGIAGIADDAAFTPGTSEVLPIGFQFDNTSPDSVDEGDIGCPRMSANRSIFVNLRDAAGNERGLNVDASGQIAVTVASLPASTNTIEVVGDAATDAAVSGNPVYIAGRGNSGTPTAMSANNDVTPLWLTLNGAAVVAGDIVDDAAFTPATSRVQVVGFTADETATDSVDEGDAGAARMTLDRKVIVTPYSHAAAGGYTPYKNLDVDETEDDIKTSAGKLFWLHVTNLHASSTRYLKIYNNVAASVSVGTTVPDLTIPIPSGTNGFTVNFGSNGMQFTTGICIAATTGFADNDTGAPGNNEVILNAGYL